MANKEKKASVEGLIEQARFIFRGTVRKGGAATLKRVTPTRETLVVKVDEVLKCAEVLRAVQGKEITVQLNVGEKADSGKTYIFYTVGWIYGAGLAVKSVCVQGDSNAQRLKVKAALEAAPARAVLTRAKRAELVVSGEVIEVHRIPAVFKLPVSEHDPFWQGAIIEIHSVRPTAAKARKPRKVTIRFAASTDTRWADAPKFSVGQAGIWILRDKNKKGEFVVTDPADFHPAADSGAIARLLGME